MSISYWMSWEGGVDLVAMTGGADQPNIIVHVARMVHTPVGSAPSGMVLIQPDPAATPSVMGFISTDPAVGAYFGPNIFAGTPFESAPVLEAEIGICDGDGKAGASIKVAGLAIETTLSGLGALESIQRPASAMPPFDQMVIEAVASDATLTIDGSPIELTFPPIGISGGPPATYSPAGVYSR